MPVWADDVCRAWRVTLDALEREPESLRTKLDWPLKKALFAQYIDSHSSVDVESIPVWNEVVSRLGICRGQTSARRDGENPVRGLSTSYATRHLKEAGPPSRELKLLSKILDSHGLQWEQLDDFLALRYELCELDMRFGELGQNGIFESLDSAGVLDHELVDADSCRRAQTEPPSAGRARIRGEAVSRLSSREAEVPYLCSWTAITGAGEILDLGDPFAQSETWRKRPAKRCVTAGDGHTGVDWEDLEIPTFLRRQGN